MSSKRERRNQPAREGLTPAIAEFLATGDLSVPLARARGETSKWGLALELAAADQARVWATHGAEVMADWIAKFPGSRPWGWWRFTATEPRRWVRTSVGLETFRCWRDYCGVGRVAQVGEVLEAESEASYLRRLNLLTDDEREQLTEDDFAPEQIRGAEEDER